MLKRRSKKEKEKDADRETMRRAWVRFHKEQLETALDGMHGDIMRGLMKQLEDLRSARALVALIAARDWSRVDADTRAVALHEINKAITKVCERINPKEPISDALPGEPPNAFRMIKEMINKFSAASGEAQPEAHRVESETVDE
jgi:hypothetical protein